MNYVILHGRISQDLQLKTLTNGNSAVSFGIAVRNDFKNSTTGEYDTQFFNCVAYGKTAEHICNYYNKGKEIMIMGRLNTRSWETESGEKRYATEIVVNMTEFCGVKGNNDNTATDIPQEINVITTSVDSDDLPF